MSDEIPFHIQELIIKRLPVVSLLRFRSVSKAWKSLIDSSDFVAAHSVTQPQHLLLWYGNPDDDTSEKYVSFIDDDTFPQQRFVHTLPPSVKLLKQPNIIGSSLGLLCLHGLYGDLNTEMVVLYNPSTRKSIYVSVPTNVNPYCEPNLGFRVCPVTYDPKIVEITLFHKPRFHCEAKVYTVSSGKWRNITSNLPNKPFHVFWPQVVVDRFIYWCAFDPLTMDKGLPNHNVIMSFDITNESFEVVELPDCLRLHPPIQLCISNLRESLVMLEYDSFVKGACGVWMMENGVKKSFRKLFTVEAPYWSRTLLTLGFRKSGQPIMEVENRHDHTFGQSEIVAYEPNSECINDLGIYGATGTFCMNSYMETLVLLDRSDCNTKAEVDGFSVDN
ncbi:putative F-box protein At1g32420 [Lactuca sativa]|uniref:putative F-box protein At1g32420 n=1 Tax=Lactuca sativa TaxID=4236 RepID=UPI000CACF19F|nr:putative F-box protein At1g32420 [Lactuca sativa]